jgi:hypothetical protein
VPRPTHPSTSSTRAHAWSTSGPGRAGTLTWLSATCNYMANNRSSQRTPHRRVVSHCQPTPVHPLPQRQPLWPSPIEWLTHRLGLSAHPVREDRIVHDLLTIGGDIRRLCDLSGVSISSTKRYGATLDHPSLCRGLDTTFDGQCRRTARARATTRGHSNIQWWRSS